MFMRVQTDNMEVARWASLGALKGHLLDHRQTLDSLVQILARMALQFEWEHIPGRQVLP